MDAPPPAPPIPLPDDVAALQAMVRALLAEVARLRADNAALQAKLGAALKQRFGHRGERRQPTPVSTAEKPTPRRDEHGRSPLPEHLERREVVHDLTEAERRCPCRGRPRARIGTQTAEQLDLDPAEVFVLRTVKKSYACRHCDPAVVPPGQRLRTAGPEQVGPIARGLCGPGPLAHVVTAEFADHAPVHRLAGQLARSGVTVPSSTPGDWLARAADLLTPLTRLVRHRALLSRVAHGDDTGVTLRVPGADRTRKARLWAGIGGAGFPYVVFDFTADHTADGPGQLSRGFTGHLQADAPARYERLYGGAARHVCCRAHARRKLAAAADGGGDRANAAVEWARRLYAVERALPPVFPPSDAAAAAAARTAREEERRRVRQRDAKPVPDGSEAWPDATRPEALPESPPGVAAGCAANSWAALERYSEQGHLAIDDNLSGRTLRAVALGRSNWGVIGSATGGRTAAVLDFRRRGVRAPGDRPVRVPARGPAGAARAGREADRRGAADLAPGSLAAEPGAGRTRPSSARRGSVGAASRSERPPPPLIRAHGAEPRRTHDRQTRGVIRRAMEPPPAAGRQAAPCGSLAQVAGIAARGFRGLMG